MQPRYITTTSRKNENDLTESSKNTKSKIESNVFLGTNQSDNPVSIQTLIKNRSKRKSIQVQSIEERVQMELNRHKMRGSAYFPKDQRSSLEPEDDIKNPFYRTNFQKFKISSHR